MYRYLLLFLEWCSFIHNFIFPNNFPLPGNMSNSQLAISVLKPYWQEIILGRQWVMIAFFLETKVCHYRNTIEYEKRKTKHRVFRQKINLELVRCFLIWCLSVICFCFSLYCHVQTCVVIYMKSPLCKSFFYRVNVFSTPLVSKEFQPIILREL